MTVPFLDAEQATKDLVNGLVALVGAGNPLVKGAHLQILHGDFVAYAEIQVTGGGAALSAENPDHRSSVTFLVRGRTRESAAGAAVALANALEAMTGAGSPAGDSARCLVADNVTAPIYLPEQAGPRYQVTADLFFRAA